MFQHVLVKSLALEIVVNGTVSGTCVGGTGGYVDECPPYGVWKGNWPSFLGLDNTKIIYALYFVAESPKVTHFHREQLLGLDGAVAPSFRAFLPVMNCWPSTKPTVTS